MSEGEGSALARVGSSELAAPVLGVVVNMLAEVMYPERVLRFPDESVGEVRWFGPGLRWFDEPTGRAVAQREVRIPAGCRAELGVGHDRSDIEFLREFDARDLQSLGPEGQVWPLWGSDLGPLAGLTQLQRLALDGTRVSDLGPLTGLTQLRELFFSETRVSDLDPLAGLAQLRLLWFSSTQVSDLHPLKGLAQLQWLDLDRTRVSDLGPLAGLAQLQWLGLSNTPVSDLGPLAGLAQLQRLYLYNTPVSDFSPVLHVRNLNR